MSSSLWSNVGSYYTKKIKELCESYAEDASEQLAFAFRSIISDFYREYHPRVYKRHRPLGMYFTYDGFVSKHSDSFEGGIYTTTKDMYNDYEDSQDDVLSSFLLGYHGRPERNIHFGTEPWEDLEVERDNIYYKYLSKCSMKD